MAFFQNHIAGARVRGLGRFWGGELPFPTFVIPAKAGTQSGISLRTLWVPAFAGMTK